MSSVTRHLDFSRLLIPINGIRSDKKESIPVSDNPVAPLIALQGIQGINPGTLNLAEMKLKTIRLDLYMT
jgi:hypothetical protein